MELSQLKTQIMTMFMMKGGNSDIYTIVYSMLLMNLVEWIFRHAPAVITTIQTLATGYFKPKREAWMPLMNTSKTDKELFNSVSMMRVFSNDAEKQDKMTNIYVEKIDAVIDFLCSLDNAKHVRMDTRYTLSGTEEMELTPLLKARVKETRGAEDSSTMEIFIFSSVLKVSDIRKWIDDIHANYVFEKNNKLGNRTFYFNEVPVEPIVQCEIDPNGGPPKQSYRWENMPKMLMFNMNEFNTSKSFGNVYGNHVDELKERLDLFVNHPEWYMDRGIPHSLGIMLHGVPGAGKTSTIKAIAKDTHRHIFNLSLRPYTSQRQLTNLFFSETVVVYSHDGAKQMLKIPLNRRVYVIEDIDCLTDVVLDRTITGGRTAPKDGDAVTLSFLLNLLDGVLETPGRILVITSNYPEKLDKALVRPGRIDVTIEFKNTDRAFILDMMNKFYTAKYVLEDIPTQLEGIFTPAEVMESMCTHFKNPMNALSHMVNKIEAKLASSRGTAITAITTGDSLYVSPNTITTAEIATAEIATAEIATAEIEGEDVFEETNADNKSEDTAVNEIVLKQSQTQTQSQKQKQKQKQSQTQKKEFKNDLLPPSLDTMWGSADFGDAVFMGGGNMPGELGVRSLVNLNER